MFISTGHASATSHDPENSSAIVDGPPDRTTSIRSRSPSRSTGAQRLS
jgi:hypothetical protein